MGAFVISKRYDGAYKFEFTSRKGKTIFTSNSFELRFECEESIEYFKETINNAVFLKFKSSSDKYFFKIVIANKELATSRKYTTQLLLQKGIDEILKYAKASEILDFSNIDGSFFEPSILE